MEINELLMFDTTLGWFWLEITMILIFGWFMLLKLGWAGYVSEHAYN